ncbi:YkoP family protein [Niallia sp. Krafla_26]|uniref:YkoP family protein n=1 Tax=Niallia sp. Krafla_26 TaxID=3064703 RepID=UPI003D1666FA
MRDYIISVWSWMDPLYYHFTRLTFPAKEGNIFRVRLTKYKGRNFVLSDGTEINKNDLLLKIHLHNIRLLKEFKSLTSELKKAKLIYNYVQRSMPEIDLYIQNHPKSNKIKGVIGITILNKGCERLGFEVFDLSHPVYRWFKQIAFLPIGILSSRNVSVSHILKNHKPSYLFMSTKKLSNMYRK